MVLKSIKKISLDSLIYGSTNFIPKLVGFFLIPVYTRFLTTADYGILGIATVVLAVLTPIYQLGIGGTIQHFYYNLKDKERAILFGNLWLFKFFSTIALALVIILLGPYLTSKIFRDFPFYPFIFIVILTTFFGTYNIFPNILFRVKKRPFLYSILTISQFLLGILLTIFFVVFLKKGALGSLQAALITSFIFFFVYFFAVIKDLRFSINWGKLRMGLVYGLPLIPHGLSGWALTFIDRIFLERMTSLSQVGIYSLGYNFGQIIGLVNLSINLAWIPFFYETATKIANKPRQLFSKILTYYFTTVAFVGLAVALLSYQALTIMVPPEFYEARNVVPIIVLGYVFHGFYLAAVTPLFFKKRTKLVALSTTGSALVNVILNIVLIPVFGIYGAAWTTVASFLIFFLVIYYFSQKYYPIKYEWKKILKALIISVVLFIIGFSTNKYGIITSLTVKSLLLVSYPFLLMIFGFFTGEDIVKIKTFLFRKKQ